MISHLIELYKLTNVFLAISFLIYLAGRSLAKLGNGRVLSRSLLRAAQISALFSLALPVVMLLAPLKLPYVDIPSFWPKSIVEDQDGMEITTLGSMASKSIEKIGRPANKKENAIQRMARRMPTQDSLWFFVFGAGILLGLGRAGLGLKRLKDSLSRCTQLRKIGRVNLLISNDDPVPFATRSFSNLYIVVPCNILGSLNYLRLAIKHEMQHHRQGDTVWMFFVELTNHDAYFLQCHCTYVS
jgi:hypothetical protein